MTLLRTLEGYRPFVEVPSDDKRQLRDEQGVHPGMRVLLGRIHQTLTAGGFIAARRLARTALTDLFQKQYQVPVKELTAGSEDMLDLVCHAGEHGFGMRYGLRPEGGRLERARVFWQLSGNGPHGFLNMTCLQPPLCGAGNVAFIPGVLEAVTEDVQGLLQKQPDFSDF